MNLRLDADQHYLTPASFSEDVKVSLVDFSQSDNDISTPDDVTIEVDDVTQNIPDDVMIYGPSITEDSRVTIVAKIEGAPRPDVAWSLDNKVCRRF